MESFHTIQWTLLGGTVRKLNRILLTLSMFLIYGTGVHQGVPRLALTHVTVIDVTGGRAQEDMTVVVSENLGNAWGGLLIDCSTEEVALKRELRTHRGLDASLLSWNTDLVKVNRLIDSDQRKQLLAQVRATADRRPANL